MCSRASGLFCACLLFSCVVHHCQCSDEHDHNHHHANNHGDSEMDNDKTHNHIFVTKLFQIFGHNGVLSHKEFEIMVQTLGISLNTSYDILHSKKCPFVPVSHPMSEDIKESQNASSLPTKLSEEESASTEKAHTSTEKILNRALEIKSSMADVEVSHFNENSSIEGSQCFTTHELLRAHNLSLQDDVLTPSDFYLLCPSLIYHLTHENCAKDSSHHFDSEIDYEEESLLKVWLYTAISVVTISMCGLLSVAIIPLIQKFCYQSLLQFLVALAVGSLAGDALLHLLPHVMVLSPEGHRHDENMEGHNTIVIWRGFTALIGIYFFYSTERLLNHVTRCRKMRRNAKVLQMPKFARSLTNVDGEQSRMVGEKLSHHKHGSYGYKFDPANVEGLEGKESLDGNDSLLEEKKQLPPTADNSTEQSKSQSDIDSERSEAKESSETTTEKPTSSPMKPLHVDVTYIPPEKQQEPETPTEEFHRETVVYRQHNHDHSYVVTLTDHHHTSHHHHHGHSHELPSTVSSVALMVVLGDGLHNFCDGLAIGAAFGSGIAGGISTSIAVLCHELPHELGDFAMLLKSGMSVKQAVLYNSISSVLCFIGSIIGVFLGNIPTFTNYISAFASGMFLYIALVNMLPELSAVSDHTEGCQSLLLLFLGLTMGTVIMLLIAIYEHDLHHLVS